MFTVFSHSDYSVFPLLHEYEDFSNQWWNNVKTCGLVARSAYLVPVASRIAAPIVSFATSVIDTWGVKDTTERRVRQGVSG